MTKLQTLYRAAIAADASVAVPGLSIDEYGRWLNEQADDRPGPRTFPIREDYAMLQIAVKMGPTPDEGSTYEWACATLERIARKEAVK